MNSYSFKRILFFWNLFENVFFSKYRTTIFEALQIDGQTYLSERKELVDRWLDCSSFQPLCETIDIVTGEIHMRNKEDVESAEFTIGDFKTFVNMNREWLENFKTNYSMDILNMYNGVARNDICLHITN